MYVFFRRIFRQILGKLEPGPHLKDLSPIQKKSISIIRQAINKPDSILLIAPISSINYVEWKDYFIKFGDDSVVITNGKFSYYVYLSQAASSKLKEYFNQKVEERRKQMEDEYDQNTIKNFDDMLNSLSK